MLFNGTIRRRLAAQLQPWLSVDAEPQLELKLGLLSSNGTLTNFNLNVSKLNQLLDDPSKLCFKQVTVEHLSLQFSPFSAQAFTLTVRGIRVVLSLGEEEDERGVRWRLKPRNTTVEERDKVLAEIDAEGCVLHGALKKISDIATRTWRTSLMNTVITHCHLQLLDVNAFLQSPPVHYPLSCQFHIRKVGAGSQILGPKWFIRRFMSSLFVPCEKSSFDVDVHGFETRLNSENRTRCVFSIANIFALVNLNNLQSMSISSHVPALNFLLTPADVSVILLLCGLLSKESKCARPGRQLWNIAATRISSLLPVSHLSLIKVVENVCLWLRYINTYQSILLLIGYPVDKIMKRSATLMCLDTAYSRSIKSHWKLITEIENDLSAEAIAVARRIIRYRVASIGPREFDSFDELLTIGPFRKLLNVFLHVLSMIGSFLVKVLFLHKVRAGSSSHSVSSPEYSSLQQSFTLKVQEISVSISPDDAISDSPMLYQDLRSFHFFGDAFCLKYIVNISEQCLTFASGCLKVVSFSTSKAGSSSYPKDEWNTEIQEREIIRGEPAQLIYFPDGDPATATHDIGQSSVPLLDCLLRKLWSNWKDSCSKSQGEDTPNVQDPWILCEIYSCMADHGLSDSTSWSWYCSLLVGKLIFDLEYYALLSAFILLRQIQRATQWSPRRKNEVFHSPGITIQEPLLGDWNSKFRSYIEKIEMDAIRLLPSKNIQIAALIGGPHIHLSLSNDQFHANTTESHLLVRRVSFEICNIELLVSPYPEDHVGLSSEDNAEHERGQDCIGLRGTQESDIPKLDNGAYNSQGKISLNAYLNFNGLKAYFEGTTEDQKYHIIVLRPLITHLGYVRKDHHSLCSSLVDVSTSSHWVVTGFSSFIFLDELHVLTKIIFGVSSQSFPLAMDRPGGNLSYEEVSSRETACFECDSRQPSFDKCKKASLVTNYQFCVDSTFELKSLDIVLHKSRKSCSLETYENMTSIDRETGRKLAMHDTSSTGICISIQKPKFAFNLKERNADFIVDTTGVRVTVFRLLSDFYENSDEPVLPNLLLSLDFLTEASISHCKLCLCLRDHGKASTSAGLYNTVNGCNPPGTVLHMQGDSPLTLNNERFGDHWLFTSIDVSGVYVAGCQLKDILVTENKFEKLSASAYVGGEFHTITCESKGGTILLEAIAATMLVESFTAYKYWISELWLSGGSSGRVVSMQYMKATTPLDGHPGIHPQHVQQKEVMWDRAVAFSMNILHPSLIIVVGDESGRLEELLFEADFHFKLELLSTVRKISTSISNLSMLSQFICGTMGHKAKVVKDKSSILCLSEASGSRPSTSHSGSHIGSSMSNPGTKDLYISPQNFILKDLRCFLAVDRPLESDRIYRYSNWVGSGSVSGFDMTISLSEIKVALSASDSFSKIFVSGGPSREESTHWYSEPGGDMEESISDGTIVAIQDVDQHMYIAVQEAQSRYDIAGVIHYSLAGERALFRVKYHKQWKWTSQVQYFSLISLYAKDSSGEPLRLNCQPRSRFVDISCPNDSGSALWTVLPFKPNAYEDAIELEASTSLSKSTFHLVNRKNDCAVAFIDGILEFVSKPGNLFKWKVLDDPGPVGNNLSPNRYLEEEPSSSITGSMELSSRPRTKTNSQSDLNAPGMGDLMANGNHLGVTIMLDKVTLTIVHELSDTDEKFPLLQGSIVPSQTIIQISNSKIRAMNVFEIILCYFDAQQNSWKEFIQPLETCTFYCHKFLIQGPENSVQKAPNHFYAKIKEVSVMLSELSLDILLFVIGQLDLAGPYAVKSSLILANCCKVENQSGLSLVCQFCDNQGASVSARQQTTISLRNLASANQPPEAIFFSVQLVEQGVLSTSPIHLSFSQTQKFAWRTRIVSFLDSKSFPGPFLVVEISRGIEDGLSVVVSPLLKIYNETDFLLELRFQRPHCGENESALMMLKAGEVIDDAMTAFRAFGLSGGLRKALTSLSVGGSEKLKESSVEWSDDLKGGKPVPLSGIFDKLSYKVRKAFAVESVKCSLSSASCAFKSEEGFVRTIHFLIQTVVKAVPVINPDNFGYSPRHRNSPVAMQEQKEVFVLPTIQLSNLLHTEIHVSLTDKDPQSILDIDDKWCQATISSGSAVNFYVDPAAIVFVVTLTSFSSSCKPVNSSDWMKKLQKQKGSLSHLDIELDFGGRKYFAMMRLSRSHRGTLEASVFTSYALQNDTNTSLFCFAANQKPLSRADVERFGSGVPPELGSYLRANSITSWFLKSHKLCFKLLEEKAPGAQLDLDALSGFSEIDLETEERFGAKDIIRLGVSVRPSLVKEVSSQIVSLSSRYIVSNESAEPIYIRQCYTEDTEEVTAINSKEGVALRLKTVTGNKKVTNVVENLLRKHTKSQNESSFFIQFRLNETGGGWSGPLCVASLGRFFVKFRKSADFLNNMSYKGNKHEFAAVHEVEEGSTIVLHFHRPPVTNLPYRIENCLHDAPITYYQKGSSEPETLGAEDSVDYVWDNLTLPHKLVVQLDDVHMLREINLDKVRSWKPFYQNKQTRGFGLQLPLDKKPEDQERTTYSRLIGRETVKVGYEVYAEGVTRVLRICEFTDSEKVKMLPTSSTKMRLRISYVAVHLLEHTKQEVDLDEPSSYVPIITAKLERIKIDSMFTDRHKYNQIKVQALSVDEKWVGAPFAAMLRRHQSEKSEANDCILHVAVVLLPTSSGVKQVKYLSIVLQPLDLNIDEETLMKIAPFWRRSLSDSSSPRQQYYFDHFEIHPIKIVASFLPGDDSHYSYSSTQETLRSLLHSVIKVPAIKTKTVELNGVLVTHALITLRELSIKCAQHYSWYAMRAIYIAKGSPLLPPAFASIFDDLASSSLDVFFDPSSGFLNLPGVTLGTLKLLSKFIDKKGFSGTKRYFGDLGKTLKTAGSNILFAAVTEISDSVLKGAETSGFNGMVNGFHQGILKLALEPAVLSSAFMEGGPDRKIKLDRSPGVDELYIEGYLQAMLDTLYKQEYLRVRVVENQVILKNLPPSSSLIDEIMDHVKGFLASKALLKGEPSTSHSLRYMRGEREWKIGPTILTLCEHLFVSFVIRMLRKQAGKVMGGIKWKEKVKVDEEKAVVPTTSSVDSRKVKLVWKWGIGKFVLSGIVAYLDGRLCRNIPNPLARRIVSGFLLSFLDQNDDETK